MRPGVCGRFVAQVRIVLAALILCAGCRGIAKVELQARVNPKHDITGIQKIAILDLESDPTLPVTGQQFANKLAAEVISDHHYEVFERSQRDKVLAEWAFQQSAVVDEASAIRAGKLLGVDGLIFGKVDTCAVERVEGTHVVTRPTFNGHYQKVTEPTLTKNGNFGVTVRMVNVQSGQVAATFSKTASATEPSLLPLAIGAVAIARLPSDEALLARLADDLARKFAAEISPRFVPATRYILKGRDEHTRRGFHQARGGAWDLAAESFHAALKANPDNGPAHNNLAVAYEKLRRYPEAKQEYHEAMKVAWDHRKIRANMKGFTEGGEYREPPEAGGFWQKAGRFLTVITGLSALIGDAAMDAKGTADALKDNKRPGGDAQYVPP